MNDPLAQYRKKPPGTVAEPHSPKGPDEYVAFDAKDKVDRLLIRSAKEQARSPGYGYLLDIAHDGPYGTNFVLYYSFMLTVLVEGRNLQPVIMALQMGTAEFIQEYDSDKWPNDIYCRAVASSVTMATSRNSRRMASSGLNPVLAMKSM